jgi:hypothetical protein
MPTKTQTTTNTQNQYNQGSMNAFNQFTQGGSNVLNQDIKDPMSQIGFNQRMQMGNQNLFNLFNSRNSAVANRASAFGGNTPLFLQNQLNRNSNALAGSQANMFNQNMLYADQLRQGAAQQMLNYHPLQTGSNSVQTQQQTGLGTWLSPLVSAGLGIATGGMFRSSGGKPGFANGIVAGSGGPTNTDMGLPQNYVPGGTGSINPWMR